tara:strand:+ start:301 stop:510 length:210 start_codon:yes stop_codon:yes gene_type:complete
MKKGQLPVVQAKSIIGREFFIILSFKVLTLSNGEIGSFKLLTEAIQRLKKLSHQKEKFWLSLILLVDGV